MHSPSQSLYFCYTENTRPNSQVSLADGLAVDEMNNIIYLLDRTDRCVVKYSNGSFSGITIMYGGSSRSLSDVPSQSVIPVSLLVDKTGYIVLGEPDKITLWTLDGQFHVVVMRQFQTSQNPTLRNISSQSMTLDRLGNLYIIDGINRVVKFNRTSTTCRNYF